MLFIGTLPAFAAAVLRNAGFSASFAATIAHDASSGVFGALNVANAAGAVTLANGDQEDVPGDAGGRFSVVGTGGGVSVSFDRGALGDGLEDGDAITTGTVVRVSDSVTTIDAFLSVTVRRAVAPPMLISAIPDQTDEIA